VCPTPYLLLDLTVLFELSLVVSAAVLAEILFRKSWAVSKMLLWSYDLATTVRMLAFRTLLLRIRSTVIGINALFSNGKQRSWSESRLNFGAIRDKTRVYLSAITVEGGSSNLVLRSHLPRRSLGRHHSFILHFQ